MVKTALSVQGLRAKSLVGELRPHMLHGTARKKLVTVKGSKRVARFFSVERGAHLLYRKDTHR